MADIWFYCVEDRKLNAVHDEGWGLKERDTDREADRDREVFYIHNTKTKQRMVLKCESKLTGMQCSS